MSWIQGKFAPHEITRYLVGMSVLFWSQIALCWWIFPAENRFSIMTHTFSFLGRWEDNFNPQGWWMFSTAMFLWGILQLPLVLYAHRRMREISLWGARIASALLVIGSINISLVGVFPDVHAPVVGAWESTHIHGPVAVLIFVGYYLGTIGYGLLILYDRLRHGRGASAAGLEHRRFILPYAMWLGMVGVAGVFLGQGERVYAALRAEAEAAGERIGSSWSVMSGTIYAFQMWENLVIYTLFIFWVWFMLSLPRHPVPTR